MTDTSKIADAILALINSQPRSPTKAEIEQALQLQLGVPARSEQSGVVSTNNPNVPRSLQDIADHYLALSHQWKGRGITFRADINSSMGHIDCVGRRDQDGMELGFRVEHAPREDVATWGIDLLCIACRWAELIIKFADTPVVTYIPVVDGPPMRIKFPDAPMTASVRTMAEKLHQCTQEALSAAVDEDAKLVKEAWEKKMFELLNSPPYSKSRLEAVAQKVMAIGYPREDFTFRTTIDHHIGCVFLWAQRDADGREVGYTITWTDIQNGNEIELGARAWGQLAAELERLPPINEALYPL